ncbi:NADH-quinone oxidoreductase subunit N [Formosimonas limnophila]|uniref:NADH-quinone oxidoreductase subunit N n=1 Tax=Formosimonas limnophila TaxID=1384487 RepID=A0A8J3FZV1_9BURK|nr:NADH-quinone oxidoreductase subunit NuoN [Formosimonas limnophila]GHA77701.1 NADH-quinone oxidoreductase subunit N [Formosimonas limnophila]
MSNFFIAYPEILLALVATAVLLLELCRKDAQRSVIHAVSLLGLAGAGILTANQLHSGLMLETFNEMFVSDPMGNLAKMFAYICVAATFVYGQRYAADRGFLHGEYYSLSLFALVGQMIMISSHHLVALYMGLELQALSLYAMAALRRDHVRSIEAAMKYFILGAIASGFMLFGISMIYGATGGALDIQQIAGTIASGKVQNQVLVFGLVFLVAGVAFKLGVVPFHMWVPDVYQGSPTAVTLMISAAPKIAAFIMVVRIFVEGLPSLVVDWSSMFASMAVVSFALGNLSAIRQKNFKRMLAYSGISHMGFVLLGFLATKPSLDEFAWLSGVGAGFYYVIIYAITTLAGFGVILAMSAQGFEADQLDDLKGLNHRNPWLAFLVLIIMFSLAGIPPLVGFLAKFVIIQGLVLAGHNMLAVIAVLFSLIGAFYYLRVVKLMYFDKPETDSKIEFSLSHHWVLSLNVLFLLALGFMPWLASGLLNMAFNTVLKSLGQ